MPSVSRAPQPRLRPFVELVWASENAAVPEGTERMLPARSAHVVLRLGEDPVRIWSAEQVGGGPRLGRAVVGGPRTSPYLRTAPTTGRSVGAVLRPGVTNALLGVPGADLAERHTSLDHVWGSEADRVLDLLAAVTTLDGLLDVVESIFVRRLVRTRIPPPAVTMALERLGAASVRHVVRESGYSHRRFNAMFVEATGLSPKRYSRLARFERTLALWRGTPAIPLADLAYAAGYSDQSHLSREFREFAGLTPAEYRNRAEVGSRHVPEPRGIGEDVKFLQDGARDQAGESRDADSRALSLLARQ